MGRVSQALQGRWIATAPFCWAGPATTATRTTSWRFCWAVTRVGGSNRAQWCNEEFNDLVQKAKVASDPAERTGLYEQAQVVFKREAPWATIAHSVVFMPVRPEVTGYKVHPLGGHIFYGVDLTE